MKRKNVKVGHAIIAKNEHGGAYEGAVLIIGTSYEVLQVESMDYIGDLFCKVRIHDNPDYSTLWVDPKHFRKQK